MSKLDGLWQRTRKPVLRILWVLISLGFLYLVGSLAQRAWCAAEDSCGGPKAEQQG